MNRQAGPPTRAVVLALIGGFLILISGISMLVLPRVIFTGFGTMLGILVGLPWVMMQNTGFATGLGYVTGVIADAIPGAIIIAAAIAMQFRPERARGSGLVILACAFVSLAGNGGLMIGAILALIGGLLAVLRKKSKPETVSRTEEIRGEEIPQKA